jgi:hypothetical protein
VLVSVEDTDAYEQAILRLCDEPKYYDVTRANCAAVSEPFYDPANGWKAAVERLLTNLGPRKAALPPSSVRTLAAADRRRSVICAPTVSCSSETNHGNASLNPPASPRL